MNDTGNRVIVGIIVVLLIIGAWYLGATYKPGTMTGSMSTSTTSTATGTTGTQTGTDISGNSSSSGAVSVGGEALSVADQPAGSFVVVSSVTLPQDGWVAIRDGSGRTLGAGWFAAGTHSAVQVPLLRNTTSGDTYQALIYSDNGDKVFDLKTDTLVMNSDGSVAGASFSATNGD